MLTKLLRLLMLLLITNQNANGLPLEIKESEKEDAKTIETVNLYDKSYALVIGNDVYTNGWPRLSNAVKDAEMVANALREQQFQVDLQLNVDGDKLQKLLKNFFIVKGSDPEARLLLWYAGHGHTVDGEGFLVATDTPIKADPSFKLSAIHMREFGGWVRLAKSKHVLAIFDSCFSGTIFSAQRARPPAAITLATTYPVRQFITSGDADQLVLDNGTFRELFVRSIKGEERADVNQDGYLTASELGIFLSDKITNLTEAHQTPRYGKLRDIDYDRGDFVISVLKEQKALIKGVNMVQSIETENTFWKSVKEINTVQGYQDYLDNFPHGRYVKLAELFIEKYALEKNASTPASTNTVANGNAKAESNETVKTESLIKKVRLRQDSALYAQPDLNAPVLKSVAADETFQVVAVTVGLKEPWYQIKSGETLSFLRKSVVENIPQRGDEAPKSEPVNRKKTMSELIEEARKKKELRQQKIMDNTRTMISDTSRRLAETHNREAQCKLDCLNRYPSNISFNDSDSEQQAEYMCAYSENYENCIKDKTAQWRQKQISICQRNC